MNEEERQEASAVLLHEVRHRITRRTWHWFGFHACQIQVHPLIQSIVDACVDCEDRLPGLGRQLIRDLGAIGGIEQHKPHYEQLMQKLAEILVLRQLLLLPWPEGTTFEHEPAAAPRGKRPELKAATPDKAFLFEVKAPSLLEHQRSRAANTFQVPVRALDRLIFDRMAGADELTLPRDNPVKDFLIDADRKFAPFKEASPITSILVIVWDDYIYEPITVLTHSQCGLLTDNSYHKDANDIAVRYANVDAVALIRHLAYFQNAAGDDPLIDRRHAFDFGDDGSLPNVIIPVVGGDEIPEFIKSGLRAVPLDHPSVTGAAEYRTIEMVLWNNLDQSDRT